MDVAAMMEELAQAMEEGGPEFSQDSACFRTQALTHLLERRLDWDRGAETPARSFAPVGGALGDHSVVILHAKVAQKSYGNEKRFFCPPPSVFIGGNVWRLMRDLLPAGTAGGDVGAYMCLDSAAQTHSDAYKLHFESLPNTTGMTACAKSLFISDADKRKHFRLLLGLFLEVGGGRQEAASFHSRHIKVISKPSQKRQSMKNAELCISARSRIALFNRLRSQTVSTRYLAVEGGAFVASARHWTAFAITLVEEHGGGGGGDFVLSEGLVCYGSVVQLVCTESGLALPPMVIRKVNKQHAITCVDEPVCQLHKCALEMRDTPRAFLAVSNDAIVLHQAAWSARDSAQVLLNDGSCWTVTGAEVVEFAFQPADDHELPACVRTPLTPFPNVTGLELNGGGGHVATLELEGENLGPHLQVCFGPRHAHTVFKALPGDNLDGGNLEGSVGDFAPKMITSSSSADPHSIAGNDGMSAMSEAAAGNASVAVYRDSFGKAVAKNVLVVAIGLSLNYVNVCLMYTFCKHQIFYLSPRYILFFHLVVNDMIQLSASVILFVLSYVVYRIGVGLCCAFILTALVTMENTPLNLACMAAECYVAVCLPLQHARLCTVRRTLLLVGAIWATSLVSTFPDLLVTLATEPAHFFSERVFCLRETAFPNPVLARKRDVTYAVYLVLVWSVLFFLYIRILFTARTANKDATKAKKARRTIVLHGVQVLLCMTMYGVAPIKMVLLRWFPKNYSDSLFACYVVVQILPRAISPIIYGVRDKCFRKYLRNYIVCQSGSASRRWAVDGSHAGRARRRNLGRP
ncbi:uncharacterized protein LOC144202699 [Stigmatopora nigra]